MAGSSSRGNKRKRSRRLVKDTTFCLNDLPDEILVHILSFLPTKSAVSTSLLSRRWRYLWASTPNFELDDYQFNCDHDEFMNFAERALVLRGGSPLVSLSLSCWGENDESRMNTLITSAIQRNVKQLSLNLQDYEDSVLPFCIFGCQSLVKLELEMCSSVRVPSMICLPRLKHLALRWVRFEDNESAEKLLSHPMLEELILYKCYWYDITTLNVNSPKLQSLSINDEHREEFPKERQVCFYGDNLKIFSYHGFLPPIQYCICGSTMQLREAVILVVCHGERVLLDMDGASNRYCKLVNNLSEVQNLTLSQETAQSLYLLSQSQRLPVFGQLTQLNLKSGYSRRAISLNSVCLTMLYQRCPHLEHLKFQRMIVLKFPAPVLRPVPSCFRTHLKKVTLQGYEPSIYEFDKYSEKDYQDAISLLFNSAPVLEEVVIHCKRDGYISSQVSTVEEVERELNARPKVSGNCRVSIVLV